MARGRSKGNGAGAAQAGRVQDSAAKLGFEAKLWQAADALRNNMDAAEYKHVALGLIFLKYISDRFEERRGQAFVDPDNPPELAAELAEDRDWYTAESVFWVPAIARWEFVKSNATSVEPDDRQTDR